MTRLLMLFGLSLLLTACASSPSREEQDQTFKTFQREPEKAVLYVYRNQPLDAEVWMDIYLDGQSIGQTNGYSYLRQELEPGRHTLQSTRLDAETLELDLAPGTLTFVHQALHFSLPMAKSELKLVDSEQGMAGVRESRLAEPCTLMGFDCPKFMDRFR